MAVRYSGDLKISMKIDEQDREGWLYHCVVSCPTCECVPKCETHKVGVRLAVSDRWKLAEDNPEAFDKIARAALGFASEKEECWMQHGHWDDIWIISRKKSGGWSQ